MSFSAVDSKRDQIIEAALKRFSHFGISKTTMSEIGDDLNISKASLYYYFPDKTSLVLSVGEIIFRDFIEEQTKALETVESFEEGFLKILDIRIAFGKKFFMMHIGDGQSDINTSDPRFGEMLGTLKVTEHQLFSNYIERFQKSGEIKELDSKATSQAFIDMLLGIWVCEVHIHQKSLIPMPEIFEEIKDKSKRLITIFCDGIKRN